MNFTSSFVCILLALAFCLSIGCRENAGPETVISGRVYDPVTEQGWADVQVIVFEDQTLDIVEGSTTDALGNYEIRFQARGDGLLSVGASASDVTLRTGKDATNCGGNNLREVRRGESQTQDFEVFTMGTLALELINENCMDETDKIELSWKSGWEACANVLVPFEHVGCDPFNPLKDSTVLVPAGRQIYEWTVTRGGVSETFVDSVTIDPEERFEFVLNY